MALAASLRAAALRRHGGDRPGPFVLSYGLVEANGTIAVVLRWDHRVTDAAPIARAMSRLEQVLNGEIAA